MQQKESRCAFAAMGLAVIALFVSLGSTGRVIADAVKEVIVANNPANPVPTTVTNTPTVAVASLPTVVVQGRDEPARQPFQRSGSFQIQAPAFGGADSFTVPAGKRLVMEYIALRSNILTGGNQIVSFSLETQSGAFSFVPETTIESDVNTTGFIAHEQLRAYVDPGATVIVSAIRNSTVDSDTVAYTLVGYYVNLP